MTQELRSSEGWFVLHSFYRVERLLWNELEADERAEASRRLSRMIAEFADDADRQAHCYSIWGHKADLGVLFIDPDLDHLNRVENGLLAELPPGLLEPVDSFVSMSEVSEYMSDESDYDRNLREQAGLSPESDEYRTKMEEFRSRMKKYTNERLYPRVPPHRTMSFYPMTKKRDGDQNWYALDFEKRKKLMAGHSITGRKYAGRVKQLVTGSTGLDAWEWGVTLFADDPLEFKRIVYEMRYDEASSLYAEFGEFLIGIRREPSELFAALGLA